MEIRPEYKIGQVVMLRSLKAALPFKVLGMIYEHDEWYYRWDRKNYAAEHMIRELTLEEMGKGNVNENL